MSSPAKPSRYPFSPLLGLALSSTGSAVATAGPLGRVKTLRQQLWAARHATQAPHEVLLPILAPCLDALLTAEIALGPAWRQVQPEQRQDLASALVRLLLDRHAAAIMVHLRQAERPVDVCDFLPFVVQEGSDIAVVNCEVDLEPERELRLSVLLHEVDQQWLIYDLLLDGHSLVAGCRAEFAPHYDPNSLAHLLEQLLPEPVAQPASQTA